MWHKKSLFIGTTLSALGFIAVGCAQDKDSFNYDSYQAKEELMSNKKPQEVEVEILLKKEAPVAKVEDKVVSQPILEKIADRRVHNKGVGHNFGRNLGHNQRFPQARNNFLGNGVGNNVVGDVVDEVGLGGVNSCVEDPLTVALECGGGVFDYPGYADAPYPLLPYDAPVFRVGYPIWDVPYVFDDPFFFGDDDHHRNDDDNNDDDVDSDDDNVANKSKKAKTAKTAKTDK